MHAYTHLLCLHWFVLQDWMAAFLIWGRGCLGPLGGMLGPPFFIQGGSLGPLLWIHRSNTEIIYIFCLYRFNEVLDPIKSSFWRQSETQSGRLWWPVRPTCGWCSLPVEQCTSHLIYPLTVRVFGAPQIISQPVSSIFPCSPLPFGTSWTPDLSILWCCLPTSSSVCLVFFPLPLCLARPHEWETCPYHFSLHLFTMVSSSSCGPIACWILARTSSLVTWSLYEMCSILW